MKRIVCFCLFVFFLVFLLPVILYAQDFRNANEYLNKGRIAYQNKQFDEALSRFMQAYKEIQNTNNGLRAMVELKIGTTYYSIKDYDKSIQYLEKAYEGFTRANNIANIALAADALGASYIKLGNVEKGLFYIDQEILLISKMAMHDRLVVLLLGAGQIRIKNNLIAQGIINYDEALKIYKDHRLTEKAALLISAGKFLEIYGLRYCSRYKFKEGLGMLDEAIDIYRQTQTPRNIAKALMETGRMYGLQYIGQYYRSLSYLQEALTIYENLGERSAVAKCYGYLGRTYNSMGYYGKALDNHEAAHKIRVSLNQHDEKLDDFQSIGFTYYKMGQYDKALQYLDQVLQEKGGSPSLVFEIGLIYFSLGQYDKAVNYFEKALQFPATNPLYMMNLALTYTRQKKFEKAEQLFLQVEEIRRNGTGHMWQGVPYLIELYLETGKYDDALAHLSRMQPTLYTDDPYRVLYHTQYGLALNGKDLPEAASREFLKAANILEEMRNRVMDKEGFFEGGFAGTHVRPFRSLVAVLSERFLNGNDMDQYFLPYGDDLASAAFYFAEAMKARVLLEKIAVSSLERYDTHLPDKFRIAEASILAKLTALENQWEEIYKKENENEYRIYLEQERAVKAEYDILIKKIRVEYPRYAAIHYPRPVSPKRLPLKENEMLLEFAVTENATYLFKVGNEGVRKIFKIEIQKRDIEQLINQYAILLQNPHSTIQEVLTKGKTIYNKLLEPVLKEIKANTHLILIPDGILGLVPFEALPIEIQEDFRTVSYVGDRYPIAYYQSASILALNRILDASKAPKNLFALGDPIYSSNDNRYIAFKRGLSLAGITDNGRTEDVSFRALATDISWGKTTANDREKAELKYPPLPETAQEVETIAGFFETPLQPPDVLLNINANESTFRKVALKNYRYLHFATHADLAGKIQGINEPFLLLGQVENNPGDNGFLTLTKVLNLNLDADLVVLSACLTGRGRTMEGEGVMNFSRAFQHAGARSVVSSLWEVASKETVEFMTIFYSKLKERKMKAESLDFARNEMRKKYPHPYFWAPFVLYGEQ